MKSRLPYILLLALLSLGISEVCFSQCSVLEEAIPGISLPVSEAGTVNRSSLAFHPLFNLYYSVNAGSPDYPMDVFDLEGTLITSVVQGFDYRGAWYNPDNGQLEGNGFNSIGVFNQSLNLITGIPNGNGNIIYQSNQPDEQSCGVLDIERDEIVYYFDGEIHRYDREDGSFMSSHSIIGLPSQLENMNLTSIIYTGCPTLEFGVIDATNEQVYLFSGVNFIVNAIVDLPEDAPETASFRIAYTNDLLWLFDSDLMLWQSYAIFDGALSSTINSRDMALLPFPNPSSKVLNINITEALVGAEMRITDVHGRVIRSWKQLKTDVEKIDVSQLPRGVFVLSYKGDDSSGSSRFVKE